MWGRSRPEGGQRALPGGRHLSRDATRRRGADRGTEHQAEGAASAKAAAERPPADGERGVAGADRTPACSRSEASGVVRTARAPRPVGGLWLPLCRAGSGWGLERSGAITQVRVGGDPATVSSQRRDGVLLFDSFVFFEGCTVVYYF